MRVALAAVALACIPERANGQVLGSTAADRARLAEVTGDATFLPRADPRIRELTIRHPDTTETRVWALHPVVRLTWNSSLPYSLNDGALWAGRGWNLSLNSGIAVHHAFRRARARVVIAPTLLYSQNLPFQVRPNTTPGRSGYANPFHGPEASLDLPHRFGDRHLLAVDPGRTSAVVETYAVEVGVSTDNEWWGPGIRNALVMSSNAAGVPRVFVGTARPFRTTVGSIEAKLVAGSLTRSLFFRDSGAENRTLSGVMVRARPAFDSLLTLGFARVVYAPMGERSSPFASTLARSLDAVVRWENVAPVQRTDQIFSLFARWVIPAASLEVYGELARMDLPRGPTEMLETPHHTGAWTAGLQWVERLRSGHLRLQTELTYLEQSRVYADRISPDFYSGRGSAEGYTQRGQVVGAAIGPGASSQLVAIDHLRDTWDLGAFLGRVRWDNDAMYRQFGVTFFSHDVSLLGGVRGRWSVGLTDFSAEVTAARRFNYLFQNGTATPAARTVDVDNLTLTLVATPR